MESIVAKKPKALEPWEEGQGILKQINKDKDKGIMILDFVRGNSIIVPLIPRIEKEIRRKLGQRVSLLRTDLTDRPYLVMQEVKK